MNRWQPASTFSEFFERNPHVTQAILAKRLGITQGHLSMIAAGKRMPRPELLLKIQQVTGISTDAIVRARVEAA